MEAAAFEIAGTRARLRNEATARCDEGIGHALALAVVAVCKLRRHRGRDERRLEAMRASDLAGLSVTQRKCLRIEDRRSDVRAGERSCILVARAAIIVAARAIVLAELADAGALLRERTDARCTLLVRRTRGLGKQALVLVDLGHAKRDAR